MNKRRLIRKWISLGLIVSALVVYAVSLLVGSARSDVSAAAREVGRRVEHRMLLLDSYISKALEGDPDQWPELGGLPEDMVVYRYRGDSLISWVNQFPLRNDDIRPLTLVQRIGDSRSSLSSPLSDATGQPSFVNYGPKWYLVKAVEGASTKVIAGLEIVDELREKSLNRHFRINEKYSVRPLSSSTGAPVSVNGVPLFLLADETLAQPSGTHSALLWLAVGLLMAGLLFLLNAYPTLPCLLLVLVCQGGVLSWLYAGGRRLFQDSQLFSPLLYADGPFLYSLGAVILLIDDPGPQISKGSCSAHHILCQNLSYYLAVPPAGIIQYIAVRRDHDDRRRRKPQGRSQGRPGIRYRRRIPRLPRRRDRHLSRNLYDRGRNRCGKPYHRYQQGDGQARGIRGKIRFQDL